MEKPSLSPEAQRKLEEIAREIRSLMGGAAGMTQEPGRAEVPNEEPTSTVTDSESHTCSAFWSRNAHCSKCRRDLEDGEPVYRARVGRGGTMLNGCHYAIEQFCKTCAPPSGIVPAPSMRMGLAGIWKPTDLPQGEYSDEGPCVV